MCNDENKKGEANKVSNFSIGSKQIQRKDSSSGSVQEYFGDRFIPCRMGSNTYEMKYQHDENLGVGSSSQSSPTNINSDVEDAFDPIANVQSINGST